MVKIFDFIVRHWAPTYFAISKASLRVFTLLCEINNQPFLVIVMV